MMKKTLIILAVFLFTLNSYSQMGHGLSVGTRFGFTNSKSFNQFKNSYNYLLKDQLKRNIGVFTPRLGWAASYDFSVMGLYTGVEFSRTGGKVKAKFESGAKRHFEMSQFLTNIQIGYGLNENGQVFALYTGLAIGSDRITTYFEYSDGTKSYGRETLLNGTYTGVHMGFLLGIYSAVEFGEVWMVYFRGDLIFGGIPGAVGYLSEHHYHKSSDINTQFPTGIPVKYDEFVSSNGTFTYDAEEYVLADFNGIKVEVGIRLNFEIEGLW